MTAISVEERKELAKKFVETVVEDVEETRARIQTFVHKTALNLSIWLTDEDTRTNVFLKMESEQVTGSFKARGAFNKISLVKDINKSLPEDQQYTIITASGGNHGLACVLAMKTLGVKGKVIVPTCASESKCEVIRKYGGCLEKFGNDIVMAEERARDIARETKNTLFISPYANFGVVHGQATIGIEILEDLPNVDTVFVCCGGGGLVSGIATYMKAIKPHVKIVSCQPINSCVMFESCKAGTVLDLPSLPTMAEGSAGGVDATSFTFDLCCQYVDEWVLVSEDEIADALIFMLEKEHKLVEGTAAVCIAAYKKIRNKHLGENIVLLVCGGNIGFETLYSVVLMKKEN